MGVRRLLALIRGLPEDSVTARKVTSGWLTVHELVALDVEVTHALLRATLAAAGVKRGQLPPELRLPRPGRDEPQAASRPPQPTPGRQPVKDMGDLINFLDHVHRR